MKGEKVEKMYNKDSKIIGSDYYGLAKVVGLEYGINDKLVLIDEKGKITYNTIYYTNPIDPMESSEPFINRYGKKIYLNEITLF